MNAFSDPRRAYGSDSLSTLSGPKVIVLCFDRLDRDLAAAVDAIAGHDAYAANAALGHAQDLLHELLAMLDPAAWEHGPTLASVYDYLIRLLTAANVTKSISKVTEAQSLVAELGSAFRQAAQPQPQQPGLPGPAAVDPETAYAGGFSAKA